MQAPSEANRRISPQRRRIFITVTLMIGFLIGLSICESALRAFNPLGVQERASWHFLLYEAMRPSPNPELVWEHLPNYHRDLVGYSVGINALGLRGQEVIPEKPQNTIRVLTLGDSMTFGMSGQQEDCYPAQLGKLYSTNHLGHNIEVVNAGVLGYTTLQEEALLMQLAPKLSPDIIVLWWFHNDVLLTGKANPLDQETELQTTIGIKPHSRSRQMIHLGYELLPCTTALVRAVTVGRDQRDDSHFLFDPESNPEGWAANLSSLRRIFDYCRTNSILLLVYTFGRYDTIAEECMMAEVPYVTSVDRAGKEHEDRYAVSKYDPHFGREGNALVAETIYKAIEPLIEDKYSESSPPIENRH